MPTTINRGNLSCLRKLLATELFWWDLSNDDGKLSVRLMKPGKIWRRRVCMFSLCLFYCNPFVFQIYENLFLSVL